MFSKLTGYDRKKLIYLALSASLIAACYAILRPLKSSIFFQLVGKEYYPLTKFFMAIAAIPCISWYSKLVDTHKKHTILYILFSIYTTMTFIFAALLSHPVLGLANTVSSPYRILGWVFTITVDFYPTFVIGTFWAFINSVSTTHFAKNGYGFIYAFIKMGSIIATIASMLCSYKAQSIYTIPTMITISAIFPMLSLIFISQITKKIPKEHLYGYAGKEEDKPTTSLGMLQGVKYMVTKPYVLGIFLLFYFYDVIFNIVEYQAHVQLSIFTNNNANSMNFYLFLSATISQFVGLFLAFLATSWVLNIIQARFALLIMPIVSASLIVSLLVFPHLITMIIAMTLLPAVHYSINSPVREMLFIPTVKQIQFKSKAWMDSFGRSLSKSSGATINVLFAPQSSLFLIFSTTFSLALAGIWGIIAYATGKKYQKTIDEKSIIGE